MHEAKIDSSVFTGRAYYHDFRVAPADTSMVRFQLWTRLSDDRMVPADDPADSYTTDLMVTARTMREGQLVASAWWLAVGSRLDMERALAALVRDGWNPAAPHWDTESKAWRSHPAGSRKT